MKSDPVENLTLELSKLPGIGKKTATRLAYFILKENSYAQALSQAGGRSQPRVRDSRVLDGADGFHGYSAGAWFAGIPMDRCR